MIHHRYRLAARTQLTHIVLSMAWNLVGLWLVSQGKPPIGPTASLLTVFILSALAAAIILSANRKRPWVYAGVSFLLFVGAALAIYGGVTKPHSLWPSEFWRYAGMLVNLVGVTGFVLAMKTLANTDSDNGYK